jgi:prefoldin subunit 5
MRKLTAEHHAQVQALKQQIELLKESTEALRERTQEAERKVVQLEDSWQQEEISKLEQIYLGAGAYAKRHEEQV